MAVDVFLKLGDVKGESKDSKHEGEIDVLSWSWGVSQTGTMSLWRRRRRRQGELLRSELHA